MSKLHFPCAILFQWPLPKLGLQAHYNMFTLHLVREHCDENKELRFEEIAKGKYEKTRICLTMKTTNLKVFVLHSI